MPSFDVVSEVDWQEVRNAVDQANREISNRFDFKNTDSRVEQSEGEMTVFSEDDYKVRQAVEILHAKLAKRGVDLDSLAAEEVEITPAGRARQHIAVRQGIDTGAAKQIVKLVKGTKLKVQASIQGEQVRVSGKKRDDLQAVINLLREASLGLPLQFINFRD